MPFPPYSVWNGIRISPRHLPPVPNPSYLFEGGLAVEVDKSALADFRPSCQAEGSRAGGQTAEPSGTAAIGHRQASRRRSRSRQPLRGCSTVCPTACGSKRRRGRHTGPRWCRDGQPRTPDHDRQDLRWALGDQTAEIGQCPFRTRAVDPRLAMVLSGPATLDPQEVE
jgi:hypothetical protein